MCIRDRVIIHTNSAKNVITLPIEIVNADKQGDFCYVVENGVVVMRRIVTGISSDTMVEVKEGLKEGDQVVYDMTGAVTEGMNVVAVPMDTSAGGMNPVETDTQPVENQVTETSVQDETQQETSAQGTSAEEIPATETTEEGMDTSASPSSEEAEGGESA